MYIHIFNHADIAANEGAFKTELFHHLVTKTPTKTFCGEKMLPEHHGMNI